MEHSMAAICSTLSGSLPSHDLYNTCTVLPLQAEIIEQERLNPSRPKPLELDPNTNMWKLDVPVRTDRVIRGAGGAMREVPQTPNIITQRPDRFE